MDTVIAIGAYDDWDLEPMRASYDLHRADGPAALSELPAEVRDRARGVLFKGHAALEGEHMDALPDLGIVANYGVGFDAIDVDAARARGVRVTNTPDVLSDDVADLAVAMGIALTRDMVAGVEAVRSGAWARDGALPLARKFWGGRAGVLGLGRIGREIADRLAAFKMEIHYHSRSEKETPGWTRHATPTDLARAVDWLFVALVGGAETEGIVSAEVLDALGEDGVIVNISRGSVIEEDALVSALEAGRLRGAALDVFRGEPEVDPRLARSERVLPLPHIGSATVETRRAMGALQRENLDAFLAGRDLPTPVA
jgi:lactate dehydrogenase-like 2-hydroxyacid dehydrogenase